MFIGFIDLSAFKVFGKKFLSFLYNVWKVFDSNFNINSWVGISARANPSRGIYIILYFIRLFTIVIKDFIAQQVKE